MTLNKPTLFLRRLVIVTQSGSIAYDEAFHKGVNIIRGKNSSGKSTISNFIFFALGGEYNNWNTESIKCREVFAEVEINQAVIVLKRTISKSTRQPMSIFWGSFEEAKNDIVDWKTYPYSQTDDKLSFTNIIFSVLGFPDVKSDNDANSKITLNQILRLLYIDQDSPTQCLFKRELFDHPLTRQAISEVLLGIYDDSLYNERLEHKKALKDYEEKKRQFDGLNKIYGQSDKDTSIEGIGKEIENTNKELNTIQSDISKIKAATSLRISKSSPNRIEKIQSELNPLKNAINVTNYKIYELELDHIDSKNFIETLEKRIIELDNSIITRGALGELTLTHCPQCLNPLEEHEKEGYCILCKTKLPEETEKHMQKDLNKN